jgi:hypothetical protein
LQGASAVPIHPVFVALVPVLSMYASLPGRPEPAEVLRACAAGMAVAALLLAASAAVYRDWRKAALFVSIVLIAYVAVGRVYGAIDEWQLAGVRVMRRLVFVPVVYLVLAAVAVAIYRFTGSLRTVTAFANVLAFGALLPPLVSLTHAQVIAPLAAAAPPVLPPLEAVRPPESRPDIYYLVFDRYGGRETIQARGVDNTAFYRYLEGRGFYVAAESRANYIKTVLSLASSLNVEYLDDLAHAYGDEPHHWGPVHDRVRNHRVGAFLRSRGYDYFHLGSWYWPTSHNPQATENLNYFDAVPTPVVQLLNNVLFEPVQRAFAIPALDERRRQWHRVRRQIDDVLELAAKPGPKFVLLHALVPHPPYVFDRDGSYVPIEVENGRTRDQNYANQVVAANRFIRTLVDGILDRAPAPPVIIVQGDEGPYPPGTDSDYYEWTQASVPVLRERAAILNAYYLPGHGRDALYPRISPVNSFRVVFNTYLGTDLPLLPDRTIRHASGYRLFAHDDVTKAIDGTASHASR